MQKKYYTAAKAQYKKNPDKDPIFGENISEAADLFFQFRLKEGYNEGKEQLGALLLNSNPRLQGHTDPVRIFHF